MKLWRGRVELTPKWPTPLAGYAGRKGMFERIADPLEANWLAFERVGGGLAVLVAIDALFASDAFRNALHQKLGPDARPIADLRLIASHTHFAPQLDPTKPALGAVDPRWFDEAASILAAGLGRSLAGEPARIAAWRHGAAPCAGAVLRRRTTIHLDKKRPFLRHGVVRAPASGPAVEREVACAIGRAENGAPLFVLWSFPCHAVAAPDRAAISADFPGFCRLHLRRLLGDAALPVLYLPGASGDLRPDVRARGLAATLRPPWFVGPKFGPSDGPRFTQFASGVASALDQAVQSARSAAAAAAFETRAGALPLAEIAEGASGAMPLAHWSSGAIELAMLGCELCSPHEAWLREPGAEAAFVTGCLDQCFGYLPSDAQRAEGGYEAHGFGPAFAFDGAFRSALEQPTRAAFRRLKSTPPATSAEAA